MLLENNKDETPPQSRVTNHPQQQPCSFTDLYPAEPFPSPELHGPAWSTQLTAKHQLHTTLCTLNTSSHKHGGREACRTNGCYLWHETSFLVRRVFKTLNLLFPWRPQPLASCSDITCVQEVDFPPSSPDNFCHISPPPLSDNLCGCKGPVCHF